MGGEKSERRSRSDEAGEPTRGTPPSKGRRRDIGTVRRERWRRHRAPRNRLNETRTDSEAGEGKRPTWRSPRWLITSTSSGCARRIGARARTARRAWTDRARSSTRANLEDNLRSLLDRAKSGHVPSAARAAGPHPEGRWVADAAHRHSDLRGQGPAARGGDGAGGRLRAGVSRLLVRLPAAVARRIKRATALQSTSVRMAGGWVLEVDIKKFFDTLDHGHLREILRRTGT